MADKFVGVFEFEARVPVSVREVAAASARDRNPRLLLSNCGEEDRRVLHLVVTRVNLLGVCNSDCTAGNEMISS